MLKGSFNFKLQSYGADCTRRAKYNDCYTKKALNMTRQKFYIYSTKNICVFGFLSSHNS